MTKITSDLPVTSLQNTSSLQPVTSLQDTSSLNTEQENPSFSIQDEQVMQPQSIDPLSHNPDSVLSSQQLDEQQINLNTLEITFFLISSTKNKHHTAMVPLASLLPEDAAHVKANPSTPSLICLQEDHACHAQLNCIPKLVSRITQAFLLLPDTQVFHILFSRQERHIINKAAQSVPRIWNMKVHRNFQSMNPPFELFRTNFPGLDLVLHKAKEKKTLILPLNP